VVLGDSFDATLAAARAGGEWAWARLYRDLAPLVNGYLRGRGALEPEDLTGEVFVALVRELPNFEGGEREFRTWALTIAHRRLVDSLRKKSRDRSSLAETDLISASGPAGDVEDEALAALGLARVMALLDRLTPEQRSVLMLRHIADLTIEEIALVLAKRPAAIKALQRRALAQLKKEIE
jgi:RNA polymerase sigma-70 factor, ECF subfamily